jgi:hypothetical protein
MLGEILQLNHAAFSADVEKEVQTFLVKLQDAVEAGAKGRDPHPYFSDGATAFKRCVTLIETFHNKVEPTSWGQAASHLYRHSAKIYEAAKVACEFVERSEVA